LNPIQKSNFRKDKLANVKSKILDLKIPNFDKTKNTMIKTPNKRVNFKKSVRTTMNSERKI